MATKIISRSKTSYLIEFFIIIAGIMVSFLLNEWREKSRIEEKKEQLLIDIKNDLRADSIAFEQMSKFYTIMVKSHDSLLANRANNECNEDSISMYLDHFASYFPFQENKTSYNRILNDQELTIEKGDTLIQRFMNLHNYIYPNVHEWLYIDKDFVLTTALPYMDNHSPYLSPPSSDRIFHGKVYYELRKKDVFMNHLKTARLFKQSNLMVAKGSLSYLKDLKNQVDETVPKIKREQK